MLSCGIIEYRSLMGNVGWKDWKVNPDGASLTKPDMKLGVAEVREAMHMQGGGGAYAGSRGCICTAGRYGGMHMHGRGAMWHPLLSVAPTAS